MQAQLVKVQVQTAERQPQLANARPVRIKQQQQEVAEFNMYSVQVAWPVSELPKIPEL
jgi:hypothetical protein